MSIENSSEGLQVCKTDVEAIWWLMLPVRYCQFLLSVKLRTRIYSVTINAICQTLGVSKSSVREYHTHVVNQSTTFSQYTMYNSKWFIQQFVIKNRNKNRLSPAHQPFDSRTVFVHVYVCVLVVDALPTVSRLSMAFHILLNSSFFLRSYPYVVKSDGTCLMSVGRPLCKSVQESGDFV